MNSTFIGRKSEAWRKPIHHYKTKPKPIYLQSMTNESYPSRIETTPYPISQNAKDKEPTKSTPKGSTSNPPSPLSNHRFHCWPPDVRRDRQPFCCAWAAADWISLAQHQSPWSYFRRAYVGRISQRLSPDHAFHDDDPVSMDLDKGQRTTGRFLPFYFGNTNLSWAHLSGSHRHQQSPD